MKISNIHVNQAGELVMVHKWEWEENGRLVEKEEEYRIDGFNFMGQFYNEERRKTLW